MGGVLGDDGVERGAEAEVPGAAAAGEEAAEVGVAAERGPRISHSGQKERDLMTVWLYLTEERYTCHTLKLLPFIFILFFKLILTNDYRKTKVGSTVTLHGIGQILFEI